MSLHGDGAMGTRINVLYEHDIRDPTDSAPILSRLASSIPSTLRVQEYWKSVDPREPRGQVEWVADSVTWLDYGTSYTAPGSIFLSVTAKIACLRTGGRWRGFLSIDPLREVHLAAFRAVGRSLGSSFMALYPDSGFVVEDFILDGLPTAWDCLEFLERHWGPPQPSVDEIDPRIAAETDHGVPQVWYLDTIVSVE